MKYCFAYLLSVALGASHVAAANTDGRSVGQTIEYEVTQVTTNKTDLSNLPVGVRAQAAKNQAAANGKKTTTNLTMMVDSIDADGNAHVNVKYSQSMEGISGLAANVLAASKEFQGTLTSDGRLLPTYDPNADAAMDSHGRYTAANAPNLNAQTMQGTFADFNAFVTGVSKHPHPKAGDAWRLVIQDTVGISRTYEFSANAPDSASADEALSVSMQADWSGQSSSSKFAATGHYNVTQHVVTGFHEEMSYASSMPNGMSNSGVMFTDINLRK